MPSFTRLEKKLKKQGHKFIAGIDEVGRGALAGPVVAVALILKSEIKSQKPKIKDSKLLSPKQRERLFKIIKKNALALSIGRVSEKVIDRVGIAKATNQAAKKAINKLKVKPDYLLVDKGINLNDVKIPYQSVIHGDAKVFSISCASIIAKVTRDRLMAKLDKKYPQYGLAQHQGYGTKEHIKAIKKYGPCPIHRRSFAPISSL